MADRYGNFEALAADTQPSIDYRIRVKDRASSVVILAPHGGTIEPKTAKIAEAIAGKDFSFYAFEALKPGAHGDFHITSHRFDEPQALDIVGRSRSQSMGGRTTEPTPSGSAGARSFCAMRLALHCARRASEQNPIRDCRAFTRRTSATGRSLAKVCNSNCPDPCVAG